MRVSKLRWVSHSKSTILSVDVQPNGYRFITGGADAYVRIWNLMPVISYDHEMDGEEDEVMASEEQKATEGTAVVDEAGSAILTEKKTKKQQSNASVNPPEDSSMNGDDDSGGI